jgi:plasmid replication initiation protein
VKPTKPKELKKHVGAIHSVHEGGLLQRKLCNALLSNAYSDLLNKETHSISISELSDMICYKSNDTKKIKQCLISLQQTNVQWNIINPETGKNQWGTAGLIGEAIIEGAICYYSYTPGMRKMLYQPEMYGRIDLTVQSKFKSSYGLALYENCIRYQSIPQTPWFELKLFRSLMGVPKDKYKVFRDLKRRVIDKAVLEVNTYSPVTLVCEVKAAYKRNEEGGRRIKVVEAIRFFISDTKIEKNIENIESNGILDKLSNEFGLARCEAKKIMKTHGSSYVQEKIDLINYQAQHGREEVENKTGLLISALKNDYQPSAKLKLPRKHPAHKSHVQILAEGKSHDEDNINKAKHILRWYEKLSEKQQSACIQDLDGYLSSCHPTIYSLFDRSDPFENIIIQDLSVNFLIKKHEMLGVWDEKNGE